MGLTHLKEFQKPAMRGIVEAHDQELMDAPSFVDTYLPDEQTFSTTFAYDIIKKSNHIAAYIGFGAEPPVIDRDAVASKHGELAKLGLKYIATEEELMAINQARSNAEKQAVIDRLVTRTTDLLDALRKRVSVSKLEAMLSGKFSYNKNGVKISVDFGVPAEHKHVQTGADAWDNADGKPITDLLAWNDKYVDANGEQADVIFMTRETLRLLQTNPEVIAEAGAETNRVPVSVVEDVLASYGLPGIQVITQRQISVKDIYTGEDEIIEYMPKFRVVFAKQGLGKYLFGPTVENNFQPGVALDVYDKQEPIQSIIRVAAAGFPIVENPFLLMYADVATD